MTAKTGMLIRRFEEQFTPHGLGYLYRENRVGAAIWVSVQVRAGFVATFVRALERLWWQTMIGFAVVLVALAAAAVVFGLHPATGGFQLLLGLASAGVMLGYVQLLGRRYHAPARVLADRTLDGPALDRAEARKLAAESQPWTVFLSGSHKQSVMRAAKCRQQRRAAKCVRTKLRQVLPGNRRSSQRAPDSFRPRGASVGDTIDSSRAAISVGGI